MKIALFAAVPEEVGPLADCVNFCGIGRENATRSMLRFMNRFQNEDFTILNIGSVGAHARKVGTILSVSEIITAGQPFNKQRILLDRFPSFNEQIPSAVLYSSDCFVSPEVFTAKYMEHIMTKADCFDMESSALYAVADEFGKKYASVKIVSDNLDVDIVVWKQRVIELSANLSSYIQKVIGEIEKNEPVDFLILAD